VLAEIYSSGVLGVDAYLVEVEVDVIRTTGDQVRFNVVGLGDMAVQESRERVRSALPSVFRHTSPSPNVPPAGTNGTFGDGEGRRGR